MLWRKGINVVRTMPIRGEVVVLAVNFAKSVSRIRNVFHKGSREPACGIVMSVSAVDRVEWDAFSVETESTEEAVWEEFRGVEEGTPALGEAVSSTAAEVSGFAVTGSAAAGVLGAREGETVDWEGARVVGLSDFSGFVDLRLDRDGEDELLEEEKGFCLILVK